MKTPVPYGTVLVYGNIGSGKSTLCKGINKALPDMRYVCIDRTRVEFDGTAHGLNAYDAEWRCDHLMMEALGAQAPVLYESTGATLLFKRARQYIQCFRRGPRILIQTTCNYSTSMWRFQQRKRTGHKQVAPAFGKRMTIDECWRYFEDRIVAVPDLLINTEQMNVQQSLDAAMDAIVVRMMIQDPRKKEST